MKWLQDVLRAKRLDVLIREVMTGILWSGGENVAAVTLKYKVLGNPRI